MPSDRPHGFDDDPRSGRDDARPTGVNRASHRVRSRSNSRYLRMSFLARPPETVALSCVGTIAESPPRYGTVIAIGRALSSWGSPGSRLSRHGGRGEAVRQSNERAPIHPGDPHENAFWLCHPKAGRRDLEDVESRIPMTPHTQPCLASSEVRRQTRNEGVTGAGSAGAVTGTVAIRRRSHPDTSGT